MNLKKKSNKSFETFWYIWVSGYETAFPLNFDYSISVTGSVCFHFDLFYGNFVALAFF